MNALLKIESLSGGYRQELVLKDISLEVFPGDFVGLIGPNGSGKTTLLRLATRVLTPKKGKVFFRGQDIFRMGLKEFCCNVAFVSQDITPGFSFTAGEIVLMGRIPHLKRMQSETRQDLRICEEVMEITGTLCFKDKLINELSAGERQRVIVARALAQEPNLLFLDEPTSHLDIGHQVKLMDLLKKLNRGKNLTIVMVLHDLNLASAYCNRIALLDNGSIFKEGAPQEVLTYQNIESVYKTVVLVKENPVTKRPNVLLVPGDKLFSRSDKI
jgi:iron complex transport system ATP-binding protein